MGSLTAAQRTVGAIEIASGNTTIRTIQNSSATGGMMVLMGVSVNGVSNVIIRNNSSTLLTVRDGSGPFGISLGNSTENVINIDGSGGITISSIVKDSTGGAKNLTKGGGGAGILTLSAANTFSGNTIISAGTLALSGSGSISSSPQIIIASGATFDVTGLTTALALGASQSLRTSATGSNTTATLSVSSSKGMTLSAGGLVFTAYGGGATSPLTVTGASAGILALNSAPVTVTTTSALAIGTYTLIAKANSATGVTGTPGTLTVNGSGLAANTTGSLSVSGGQLILTGSSSGPKISSSGTLSAVNTTYGAASASPSSFNVSGTNMSAGITVTPPTGFQVSTSSDFSSNVGDGASPITVGAAGTIASTTVYVRLKSSATVSGSPYSGNIVLSSSGASNVNVATASSTVSAKSLTITGLSGANKPYDGGTSATATGTAALSGIVSGDESNVTLGGSPVYTFASANAGNGISISTSGYSISGSASGNYSLTQPTLSANITKVALTITAANQTVSYGTPVATVTGAGSYTPSGFVNGESSSVIGGAASYTTNYTTTTAVGSNVATITPVTSSLTATNYSFSTADGNISVTATVPTLTSPSSSSISTTSALLGATVSSDGGASLTARGTVWGTSASPTGNSLDEGGTSVAAFSHSRTGFTANTLYYFRGYATNSAGTAYSSDGTFTTLHNAPTIASPSSIGSTGFTANWTAPAAAGAASFTYSLQYSTTSDFTSGNTSVTGISSGTTSYAITGLTAGTQYWYRVLVNNAGGNGSYSASETATTTSSVTPTLTTPTSSAITNTSATLGATITSDGGASITGRGTVYGLSANPTANDLAEGGTSTGVFSHSRTGLTPNTLYYFRGYATNSAGTSYSTDGTFTTLHNAPTSASATTVTTSSFVANWTAPVGGGSETYTYTLQYSTTSDFSSGNTSINSIASSDLSKTVTGLTAGQQYWYRIRVNNAGGNGDWSSSKSVTLLADLPTLTSPTATSITTTTANLGATISSNGGGSLTERGTVFDITSNPTSNASSEGGTSVGVFTHSRTGLTPNTYYYYRGYAINSAGTAYSSDGNFTTLHNAPTSSAASSILSSGFTANWSAPTGGGSASFTYTLQYSTTSDFSSGNASLTGINSASTSQAVTSLSAGTQYWYRVMVVNAGGNSAWSSTQTLSTLGVPTVTSPTVTSITTSSATLGATVTSDGGASLSSRGTVWGTTSSPTSNALAEGNTSVSLFTHSRTGLTPNTLYYYRGYAVNSVGTGYSSDGTFTTLHNAPTSAAATSISKNGFTANWSAPTGGGSETFTYTLQYSTTSDFSTGNTSVTSISSASISQAVTGLNAGTQYWYRVMAVNAGGNSAWSSSQNLTTSAETPGVLLTEENFTFSGALTSNGYTAVSGSGTNALTAAAVSALSYSNYGSSGFGNGLAITTSGEDVVKSFTNQVGPATIYSSFLVNVSAAQSTGDYFFAISPSNGSSTYRARTFIKSSGAGYIVGISTSSTTVTWGSTVLSFNTVYHLVVKYTFTSATSAVASIYVNPSSTTEPASAEASQTEGTPVTNAPADINYYAIRQGNSSNAPTLTIDGIRIATGWGTATGNPQYSDATAIATGNYNNVSIYSGATTTLSGNPTINGALTFNGGNLSIGSNTLTLSGTVSNMSASRCLTGSASSNLTINGTGALGTLFFDQTTPGTTDDIATFTMNRTSTGTATLGSNVTVETSLVLTNGLLQLGSNNLTIGASATIPSGSNSSYVQTNGSGTLTVNSISTTGKLLAIGNSTYNPITIALGNGYNWSARVEDAVNNVVSPFNTNRAVIRTWHISPSTNPPASGATITFQYNDGDATQLGSSFVTSENVQLWHWGAYGGIWTAASGSLSPSGTAGGTRTITVTGLRRFSPYAIANISGPLPVSLLSFSGYKDGTRNQLRWVTASESNNRGFEVERSADGRTYQSIGFVNSLAVGGNSQSQLRYSFTDLTPGGNKQYYRLKQSDIDGRSTLSNILLIQGEKPTALEIASVFPNPSNGQVTVLLNAPSNDNVNIRLLDMMGRILETRSVNVLAGSNSIPFDLSKRAKGQYFISVGEKVVRVIRE